MPPDSVIQKLNQTAFRDFIPIFSSLKPVKPESLNGRYAAAFTGPAWLRKIAPLSLSIMHFKGWCGKRFYPGGETGINLFLHSTIDESYPFTAQQIVSIVDKRTSLVVRYSQGVPFPWVHIIDELRQFDDICILGMTVLKSHRLPLVPFPFLLYPWEDDHAI